MARPNQVEAMNLFDELAARNGIEDKSVSRAEDLLPSPLSSLSKTFLPRLREKDIFGDLLDGWGATNNCGGLLRTTNAQDPFAHLGAYADPPIFLGSPESGSERDDMSISGNSKDISPLSNSGN